MAAVEGKQQKRTYLQMIEEAIIILADRKGSSREALWKVVHSRNDEADRTSFLFRLKKLSHEGPI